MLKSFRFLSVCVQKMILSISTVLNNKNITGMRRLCQEKITDGFCWEKTFYSLGILASPQLHLTTFRKDGEPDWH
jgi:hypothetical protein